MTLDLLKILQGVDHKEDDPKFTYKFRVLEREEGSRTAKESKLYKPVIEIYPEGHRRRRVKDGKHIVGSYDYVLKEERNRGAVSTSNDKDFEFPYDPGIKKYWLEREPNHTHPIIPLEDPGHPGHDVGDPRGNG